MARSYDADRLIVLPRLDASGADALVTEVLARARAVTLPASIERARKHLEAAQKVLRAALSARHQALPSATKDEARAADRDEDAAFSAIFDWSKGLSKLPDALAESGVALRLHTALFGDGLTFTQLPYKLEWAEADARVRAIANDPSLEEAFTSLGGKVLLDNLRRAHKRYGRALGVTSTKAEPEAPLAGVGEPLAEVIAALRLYALRVAAHAEGDDAEDASLSELLAPLVAWEGRVQARSSSGASGDAQAPASPSPSPLGATPGNAPA